MPLAIEDFADIAAKLQEIEKEKEAARQAPERPASTSEHLVDYGEAFY